MLLTYYLLVLVILGAWYGVLRTWQKRIDEDVRIGSEEEWKLIERKEPKLLEGLTQDRFREIFARVEAPRAPFYTFTAVGIFLVFAPLVLALTTTVIRFMELSGIIPQPGEQAQQIQLSADGIRLVRTADLEALQLILQGWGGFFNFFSLLLFWVIVFYAVMRRYHLKRPGTLRDEVLRSR
ncbi:hypothetical protein HK107_05895 [Parvularcula sp. ZS-1/3]|uniref:Uncharacterized protein n=1 Tax=Parvularcula mediterranea TaxID=2732508 RepID=A0A7Y3RM90_9PROT|nr:hypothetical protein [Parvularcula mediterranea]NNU15852.1 hypothetical protein [Parvularcula mediterranea]